MEGASGARRPDGPPTRGRRAFTSAVAIALFGTIGIAHGQGIPKQGVGKMPPYDNLPDKDLQDLASYLLALP